VKNSEEWVTRFESPETEGPALITIMGYLFGLAFALSLLS
jgi:hypothetical protein